jgi:hypothetical protein
MKRLRKSGAAFRRRLLPVAGALPAILLLVLTYTTVPPDDGGTAATDDQRRPDGPASRRCVTYPAGPCPGEDRRRQNGRPAQVTSKAETQAGAVVRGSYIVTVTTNDAARIRSDARNLAVAYSGRLGAVWTAALHGFPVRMSAADAARLRRDKCVASLRPTRSAPRSHPGHLRRRGW